MSAGAPLAADDERTRAAAELAARIRTGDRRAEDELVTRFAPGLLYLLRHLTGDPALAEDLRQETFAIALPKLRRGELHEPGKLAAFLRGTAKNLVRAGRRKQRRRAQAGETPMAAAGDDDAAAPGAAAGPEPTDPAPSPLQALLLDEEIGLAERLLGELASPRDREVLFRFCVAEEDREEICSDLGLGRAQFNLVLFRARQRFRQLYEAAVGEARERRRPGRGGAR